MDMIFKKLANANFYKRWLYCGLLHNQKSDFLLQNKLYNIIYKNLFKKNIFKITLVIKFRKLPCLYKIAFYMIIKKN